MGRTRPCNAAQRIGRLSKAKAFLEAAKLVDELNDGDPDLVDAAVTLYIHAGIAAADMICCARLGEHALGENHIEAVQLLDKADKDSAKYLRTLLGSKTKSGYSAETSSTAEHKQAQRAAAALVARAGDI
ncbi:MAG TPA: hypothetical protein VNQ73_11945 [Ilumatobacter sp.]|nr:hypothetical protein [Ilumatobacter sp.]